MRWWWQLLGNVLIYSLSLGITKSNSINNYLRTPILMMEILQCLILLHPIYPITSGPLTLVFHKHIY